MKSTPLLFALLALSASAAETSWKFTFGSAPTLAGTAGAADTRYATGRGFGFEPGSDVTAQPTFVTSDKPFLFSVAVPEGSYLVTVTLGAGPTTVKSE